ncbi:flagellar basal body P-ring protein FlgI [Candidatus Uabimicrobium amorphum]|uniref:Flagellar P-ring protein n=1 Tax=Uabimicrobium amorphum TaxID=2596890 RepID=A0A5S9INJ1_UABAM|nr:flagellar basal body P-ring protein FlgI [Candidatus Uabimicrobium amorphum]BBM84984.1 flagellar P-ring protein [Candidatus Uabimicrobium amorphum]
MKVLVFLILLGMVHAARIKDIVEVVGLRENPITGMGLVVGLPQTGDQNPAALKALRNVLQHYDFRVSERDLAQGNVALVMATAQLPPLATRGTKIRITVSAIGDATSLNGGVLLPTFLKALNKKIYAVGQGTLSTDLQSPTVATVHNGIVERDAPASFVTAKGQIFLRLKNPDFNTANRISQAIMQKFDNDCHTLNLNTVRVQVPYEYKKKNRISQFIAEIYTLEVIPDIPARVVINERTGSIIAGDSVTISPVTITHNTIKITIGLNNGQQKITVEQLTNALLSVGATSKDLVVIFRMLEAMGALHAKLIFL